MLDYICKKCGCGNAPGSKFCTGCGEPIVIEDADPATECSIEAPVEDDMEATTENNAKAISEDNAEVTAEDNAEAKTDDNIGAVPEEQATPEEPAAPVVESTNPEPYSQQYSYNTQPVSQPAPPAKKSSAGRVIASIFIVLIMFFLGLYSSIGAIIKSATTEKNITKIAQNIDVSDISLPNEATKDLSEYVTERIEYHVPGADINKKDIEEILNQDYVKDFIKENLGNAVDEFLLDEGSAVIDEDEVRDLMDRIYKDLPADYNISQSQFQSFTREVVKNTNNYNDRIDDVKEDLSTGLTAIRIVFSYPAIFAALGVFVFLFILLICINRSGTAPGVVGIILGIINCAIGLFTLFGSAILIRILDLGKDVYKAILHSFTVVSLNIGGGLIIISIIVLIISGISKKKRRSIQQ